MITMTSANLFRFDFSVASVLNAGIDIGLIVAANADDSLVLMDEPAFPGCVLACRPVGVIEGEQKKKGTTQRNDRKRS